MLKTLGISSLKKRYQNWNMIHVEKEVWIWECCEHADLYRAVNKIKFLPMILGEEIL